MYPWEGGEFELETSEFVWIKQVGRRGSGQRENSSTTPRFSFQFIFQCFLSSNKPDGYIRRDTQISNVFFSRTPWNTWKLQTAMLYCGFNCLVGSKRRLPRWEWMWAREDFRGQVSASSHLQYAHPISLPPSLLRNTATSLFKIRLSLEEHNY